MFCYFKAFSGMCIINGRINNSQDNYAVITKPVMGFFNAVPYEKSDTLVLSGNYFSTTINCTRSVFVTIFFSGFPVRLLIQPGDSIYLTLDLGVKSKEGKIPCTIKGANHKGQMLFYDYNYWPAKKYEAIWAILKENKDNIVSAVKNEIISQVLPFKKLYIQKEIDEGFYKLMSSNITALLLFEAIRKILDPNIQDIKMSVTDRKAISDQLIQLYNGKYEDLYYGLNSLFYAQMLLNYKKALSLNIINLYDLPDTIILIKNKPYLINGSFSYLLLERGQKLQEILFGSKIIDYLRIGGGEERLKDEISYFKDRFPISPYNTIISQIKKVTDKNKTTRTSYQKFSLTPVSILDSTGAIKDLQFKEYPFLRDSIVFVDVWATWCAPCISEMQYNFPVDSLLYQYKIKRLYISIDNINDKEKWINEIFKMRLSGYHILAGPELQSLLAKNFGLGESLIAIPRYFIVKRGKIIVPDAFRPSEFDKLKNQIKEISDIKKLN